MTSETIERMSAAEKATWAAVFADCPDWCDGTEHLEGMAEHQGTVGYVDHVTVGIESKGGTLGVSLFAEGRDFLLTAEQTEQVVALLRRAQAIVTGCDAE